MLNPGMPCKSTENEGYVIYSIAFVDEWARKIIDAAARRYLTEREKKEKKRNTSQILDSRKPQIRFLTIFFFCAVG